MKKTSAIQDLVGKWIKDEKFGNIIIKGTLIIGKENVPIDAKINFYKGNIQSIQLTETIFLK